MSKKSTVELLGVALVRTERELRKVRAELAAVREDRDEWEASATRAQSRAEAERIRADREKERADKAERDAAAALARSYDMQSACFAANIRAEKAEQAALEAAERADRAEAAIARVRVMVTSPFCLVRGDHIEDAIAGSDTSAAVGRRGSDVPTSGLLADESKDDRQ